jgi:DNA-binding PadR family transcriptional regulator
MSELSGGDYVFLALLAHGPMSAYDVKKAMASSISFFWSAQHSQVYQQAGRLQRDGYIEPRGSAGARNRTVLGLTRAGREAVDAWLREPAPTYRIYDQALAKLFFADLADPGTAARLLEDQQRQHAAILEGFTRIKEALETADHGDRLPYPLYTLLLGIRVEHAYLDWLTLTLADLAARTRPGPPEPQQAGRPGEVAEPCRRDEQHQEGEA